MPTRVKQFTRRIEAELQAAHQRADIELAQTLLLAQIISGHLGVEVTPVSPWTTTMSRQAAARYHDWLIPGLVDLFLIKARNLIAFFYGPKQRDGDIVAADFFEDPEQWTSQLTESEELLLVRDRVSKAVAHLTYVELGNNATWNARSIGTALATLSSQFSKATGRKYQLGVRAWLLNFSAGQAVELQRQGHRSLPPWILPPER